MKGIGGHQSPKLLTCEWATPPHVIAALGGADTFALDPCAMVQQPWACARSSYNILSDGLAQRWQGDVYCNPPYGESTGAWLERMADHGNGIALVFARTETDAFQAVWQGATAVLFLRGRLFFHRPDGTRAKHNSGAPSVLIAYGEQQAERLLKSGLPGFFAELQHGRLTY